MAYHNCTPCKTSLWTSTASEWANRSVDTFEVKSLCRLNGVADPNEDLPHPNDVSPIPSCIEWIKYAPRLPANLVVGSAHRFKEWNILDIHFPVRNFHRPPSSYCRRVIRVSFFFPVWLLLCCKDAPGTITLSFVSSQTFTRTHIPFSLTSSPFSILTYYNTYMHVGRRACCIRTQVEKVQWRHQIHPHPPFSAAHCDYISLGMTAVWCRQI